MSQTDSTEREVTSRPYVDRRKRPDCVVRSVTVVAVLGWLGAITALVLLDRARPAEADLFTRLLDITIESSWNTSMLRWSLTLILASFVATSVGFILNATRKKRKTDKYSKLLITLGALSIVFIAVFLINYAGYL